MFAYRRGRLVRNTLCDWPVTVDQSPFIISALTVFELSKRSNLLKILINFVTSVNFTRNVGFCCSFVFIKTFFKRIHNYSYTYLPAMLMDVHLPSPVTGFGNITFLNYFCQIVAICESTIIVGITWTSLKPNCYERYSS
jgi:hypothetical protein